MIDQKVFTVVAGPNGAGKTTFVENAFAPLVNSDKFLNADYVARDLSPNNVSNIAIQAGKEFLKELDQLILGDQSFLTETTLSGKTLLKKVKSAKNNGFFVVDISMIKKRKARGFFKIRWTNLSSW